MCPSLFAADTPMADEDHEGQDITNGVEAEQLSDGPSIEQLLADGKRNLVCDDFSLAVNCFADACELLAVAYGDQATELAEPLYYYGKALLELARTETGVLGDKVPGDKEDRANDSDSADDSDSQVDDEEPNKAEEQRSTNKSEAVNETKDPDGNSSAAGDTTSSRSETTDSKVSTASSGETSTDDSTVTSGNCRKSGDNVEVKNTDEDTGDNIEVKDKDGDDGDGLDEEDEGELSTLQLAWETLEVSRGIYAKLCEERPECWPRLADVHMTLSMLEIEEEKFDEALEDCLKCLRIQMECLSEHHRSIAETHYQLAMIYQLTSSRHKGLDHLHSSKRVLNMKLKLLEDLEHDDNSQTDKEIKELKLLLPDIESKINDAIMDMRDAALYEQQLKAQLSQGGSTQIGFSDSPSTSKTTATPIDSRKVNDISNLVRKRKSDQAPCEEQPTKKSK